MSAPILALLRDPRSTEAWTISEWADTLPRLAQGGLTAHAAGRLAMAGRAREALPSGVVRQFDAGNISSIAQLKSLRWELNEVARALHGSGIVAVPLKGADYLLRGATPAVGRFVNDVDILIRQTDVPAAQAAFEAAGWDLSDSRGLKGHHQLPLMTHGQRQSQLEVHFQLVAEGGAVGFDVEAVIAAATPLADGVLALLQPEDTTLVCVAHFIRNSRSISAFRDLLDLRELIADFTANDPEFGVTLAARAEVVGLGPALARALRDTIALFGETASPNLDVWARRRSASLAGGSAFALVPDGCVQPGFMTRVHRVGRMFARMRSLHSRAGTLRAGMALLFPKEAADD